MCPEPFDRLRAFPPITLTEWNGCGSTSTAYNLRDVGEIPTSDGGKIVPGRLLRSDNLQTLTAAGVDQLLGWV